MAPLTIITDMGGSSGIFGVAAICALLLAAAPELARSQEPWRLIFPEQRRLEVRDPSQLPRAPLPDLPVPQTVSAPQPSRQPQNLSLDDAIRTALANARAIRILTGVAVVSSGQTIYDPAITNTQIDQARARFDPSIQVQNDFNRRDQPQGAFVPGHPTQAQIVDVPTNDYDMALGLAKNTVTGGTANLGVHVNPLQSPTNALPLNPQTVSSIDLSFTQPLLQGAGSRVNMAPIVIARIETERSFFQMKDAVQEMVRGVVEAYWSLVFARTEAWARRQQVEQGLEALQRAEALLKVGLGHAGDVAQARVSLANFRANLITAEASVLQREAALRNILGLPPSDTVHLVPVTPVSTQRLEADWTEILRLAEGRRPDLIELKLILEADQQRLLMADNQALPRVDGTALYRWNGLEGRTPDGTFIASGLGQTPEWQLGVNFSVPLGLRQARAALRQQELLIMHDRANLGQGLHNAAHVLAASYRNLDQYYTQYRALAEARDAAYKNIRRQLADFETGRETIYLNVLQAITDWGNSVTAEAQSLTQYNTELANLERLTGTILETHGVRFVEEQFCAIGPLGRLFRDRPYPLDDRPGPNADQYPSTSQPAENAFHLDKIVVPRRGSPERTPPTPLPPGAQPQGGIPSPPESDGLRFIIPGATPEQIPLPPSQP